MTGFALTLVGAAALSLVDLATHRLPNRMLYPTAAAGIGALVVAALSTGHAGSLLLVPLGLVLGMLPYVLIWLFRPAGMGFGDVRMAGMLGAVTAVLGLDAVVVMLFSAALGQRGDRRRPADRRPPAGALPAGTVPGRRRPRRHPAGLTGGSAPLRPGPRCLSFGRGPDPSRRARRLSLAGKSTTGRILADRLGVPFVDADDEIVAGTGEAITTLFERRGEQRFRDLEAGVVARLLAAADRSVIALGGGAPMRQETRAALGGHDVVWLRAAVHDARGPADRRRRQPATRRRRPGPAARRPRRRRGATCTTRSPRS